MYRPLLERFEDAIIEWFLSYDPVTQEMRTTVIFITLANVNQFSQFFTAKFRNDLRKKQ